MYHTISMNTVGTEKGGIKPSETGEKNSASCHPVSIAAFVGREKAPNPEPGILSVTACVGEGKRPGGRRPPPGFETSAMKLLPNRQPESADSNTANMLVNHERTIKYVNCLYTNIT